MVIPATACPITHPMPWATGTAAVGIKGKLSPTGLIITNMTINNNNMKKRDEELKCDVITSAPSWNIRTLRGKMPK